MDFGSSSSSSSSAGLSSTELQKYQTAQQYGPSYCWICKRKFTAKLKSGGPQTA